MPLHASQRARNRDRKGEIQRERAGERDPAREPERALEKAPERISLALRICSQSPCLAHKALAQLRASLCAPALYPGLVEYIGVLLVLHRLSITFLWWSIIFQNILC